MRALGPQWGRNSPDVMGSREWGGPQGGPQESENHGGPSAVLTNFSLSLFHFQLQKKNREEPEKKRFGIFFCFFISERLMENSPLAMGRVR